MRKFDDDLHKEENAEILKKLQMKKEKMKMIFWGEDYKKGEKDEFIWGKKEGSDELRGENQMTKISDEMERNKKKKGMTKSSEEKRKKG